MKDYPNQLPVDREINVNPSAALMYKINTDGIIEYVNHALCELSGYEEFEIIGESMDILRHPDMPDVIYEILKERLEKKEPIRLVNKVLAKDGRYFWLLSDFETKANETNELVAHFSHSTAAPSYAVHKINSLYKILSKIESKSGKTDVSKRYLIGFLEERNLSYNQYLEELSINHPEYEKQFQQPTFSERANNQTKDSNPHIEAMSYNSNLDLSSFDRTRTKNQEAKEKPVKKRKSLFKRVFGK